MPRFIFHSVLFVALVSLAACQPPTEAGLDSVTLRLGWIVDAHQAGFWVALDRGYYKDQNLQVEIQPGGADVRPIQLLASGSADFAQVGGIEEVILARSAGVPVKTIAALHQLSPHALVSLRSSDIELPADLEGKTVAVGYGDAAEYLYRSLVARTDLAQDSINEVPFRFDITPLMRGDVDVVTGFRTDQPASLRAQGFEPSTLNYDDYGIRSYGYSLVAMEDTISSNPDLVERFLRATLEGWKYALNNPDEAIASVIQHGEGLDAAIEADKLRSIDSLMRTEETDMYGLGLIDPAVLKSAEAVLLESSAIEVAPNVEDLYDSSFLGAINSTRP